MTKEITDKNTPKGEQPTAFQPVTKRGNAPVPVSLLDFAITGKGYSAIETIQNSIELAKLADQRGFARFWVAEHHSMPAISVSSPAVMLSRPKAKTKCTYGRTRAVNTSTTLNRDLTRFLVLLMPMLT
ncbi:LLM class flavin-dependent oxidoreductase [Pontibacter sp. HSC-36F09]|uniref:LLM class flavin-dependent oxidoreductase n=1 Tax=Pontibacter sp. HSC-36F09 TaxID=2910966 RepID=UPI0020A0A946|nr:LLM class flavin-dependent oxidoreductase [Pontibacter sp. HSC-36F09]MCP2044458.1 hypothetical protein [Pontibacter sp. HSC-36F09]